MKYLIIITALLSATLGYAETQTKRPSWSQGLPERQSSQLPGKPGFTPEPTEPSTQSQPKTNTDRPVAPHLEIELTTQPELDFSTQPEAIEQRETEPVRRVGYRRLHNRATEEPNINPLHQQYKWAIVETTPIDIPAHHVTKNQLKVRIFINPNGEVVRVAAGAPDVPALMLKQAQKSIEKWRFEPPKNLGITDNLAKTFTIEIKTG